MKNNEKNKIGSGENKMGGKENKIGSEENMMGSKENKIGSGESNISSEKNKMSSEEKTNGKPTPMDVALSVVRANIHTGINTDPQGSWTGVPADRHEQPIQDADDL